MGDASSEISSVYNVPEAPNATDTPLYDTELLVNEPFPMFEMVLLLPEIVLFVNVSVVARPTNVSVLVGNVNVPVLVMLLMIGLVNVLLVSVCDPVNVTKVSEPEGMVSVAVPDTAMVTSPVPDMLRLVPAAPTLVMVCPLLSNPFFATNLLLVVAMILYPHALIAVAITL